MKNKNLFKINPLFLFSSTILIIICFIFLFKNNNNKLTTENVNNQDINQNNTNNLIQDKNNILGNKDDLISFSTPPFSKVHGILSYRGSIKGGYFFEGNVIINILGADQKILKQSNAVAKTDWTTAGPVDFEGNIDFSGLKKGPGYIQIHNDNASGLPQNNKSILIPIIIE